MAAQNSVISQGFVDPGGLAFSIGRRSERTLPLDIFKVRGKTSTCTCQQSNQNDFDYEI